MTRWSALRLLLQGLLYFLMLSAALQEDQEALQKENKELEELYEEEPGPPMNVTLTPTSATSFKVTWDPAPGATYYIVYWQPGSGNEIAGDTFYLAKDLEECTEYMFTVSAEYSSSGDSYESSPVFGNTDAADPPPAPDSCYVETISSTSVKVKWEMKKTDCPIVNYSIKWLSETLWLNETIPGEESLSPSVSSYTISPLLPYSNVTVQVAASNTVGSGSGTECWNVTLEEAPGPPAIQNTASPEGTASAEITWEPPEETNGIILHYEVSLKGQDVNTSAEVAGGVLSAVFDNLVPCGRCEATVRASTSVGWGDPSQASNLTVNDYVLPSSVTCDKDEATICITPSPSNCDQSHYNVTFTSDVLWSNDTASESFPVTLTGEEGQCREVNISTEPYTKYTACVSTSERTDDPPKCCDVITPQQVPGPAEITDIQVQGSSAKVSWMAPQDKNGVLTNYRVVFEGEHGNESASVPASQLSTVVDNLCGHYDVTVTPQNGAGWGPASDPKHAFIDSNVMPEKVSCSSDHRQVEVCVVPLYPGCPVQVGYSLSWTGVVGWDNQSVSGSDTLPWEDRASICYMLEDAVPYTTYITCVGLGDGNDLAECCGPVLTPEEVPSSPTHLQVEGKDTSVTLAWEDPREINGRLESWNVVVLKQNETYNTTAVEPSERQCTVHGLQPATDYQVQVMAVTGAGPGEPAEEDVSTNPYNPPAKGNKPNTGLIVGGTITGVFLVLLLGSGGVYFYKKKRKNSQHSSGTKKDDIIPLDTSPGKKRDDHDTYSTDLYYAQHEMYAEKQHEPHNRSVTGKVTKSESLERSGSEGSPYVRHSPRAGSGSRPGTRRQPDDYDGHEAGPRDGPRQRSPPGYYNRSDDRKTPPSPYYRRPSAAPSHDPRRGPEPHHYKTHSGAPRNGPGERPLPSRYYRTHNGAPGSEPRQRPPEEYYNKRRPSNDPRHRPLTPPPPHYYNTAGAGPRNDPRQRPPAVEYYNKSGAGPRDNPRHFPPPDY